MPPLLTVAIGSSGESKLASVPFNASPYFARASLTGRSEGINYLRLGFQVNASQASR